MKYIIILMFLTTTLNAQDFETSDKTLIGVFEVKDRNKVEIYSSTIKWISIKYNSSKDVIQMEDDESGNIIVKGINEITYKNRNKALMPDLEYSFISFNHLIEFNVKDNKFRIIYKIIDVSPEDADVNNLVLNCINLNGADDNSITAYNEYMDLLYKKALVNKKKREAIKAASKPMFEEINVKLLNEMKSMMLDLHKNVLNSSDDDW